MLTVMWFVYIGLLVVMTKQPLEFSRDRKLAWLPLTAYMLVEANDSPTASHYPVQIMGDN